MGLVEQMVELHRRLAAADLPHAFGGALALAWCTERARGTIDIDVNVFVPPELAERVFAVLPPEVTISDDDRERIVADGQVRLWWGSTPIDLFLSTTDYHDDVGDRVRSEHFAGTTLPFLSCLDLAVFKAFFDRTKDWADLEEMQAAGTLDVARVAGILVVHLGADDHRIARLRELSR